MGSLTLAPGTDARLCDHVTLRASDLEASARFYDRVLATLGVERTGTADWILEWGLFSISPADDEKPPTRGLHIGFSAPSRAHVDAFWHAGVDAGYRDDGQPGPRPEYTPDYCGGFLRDPDGNSAEAVHHDGVAEAGVIDHLWIRVADVEAAKAFYVTIAGDAGIRLAGERPHWAHFAGAGYRDNGRPRERPQYSPGYYGAFALDPDGNNIEAVFHDR
jgi:catechol 2,3-dioxygenase-like lactoylglutathione lyase family enzyme